MAEREYDLLFKILLIGDANVGKTSLLSRFIGGDFQESYKTTIGVDFKVQTLEMEERVVKLQIWDTGGQERFAPLVRSYFRGGHGVAIVYDVTQRASFERVTHWADMVKENASEDVEIILIGNKSDLENREVTSEEGQELANSLEALWMETSAKCDENVNSAFFNLASKIFQQRRSSMGTRGGPMYGPPPQTYGPPVDLRAASHRNGCCHHLGPPGNAYHEGSHVDRPAIMQRSMEMQELPSLSATSPGTATALASALYAGRPLLLRRLGAAVPGAAVAARLERLGERRVPVAQLKEGKSVPPFRCQEMKLKDFLRVLRSKDATRKNLYLQQLPVMQFLPELETLGLPVKGPDILQTALGAPTSALVTCTLFCGAAGIRTSLHFDRGDWAANSDEAKSSIDNLFLQLSGRKRFRLFRPGDHDRLYARGLADPSAPHVSMIEDTSATGEIEERFPLFPAALRRSFVVDLEPGDALLVPRWWWHETLALSDGHAVNWWFEPRAQNPDLG